MPSRRSKELWEQFKTACDAVYEKVKAMLVMNSVLWTVTPPPSESTTAHI